MSPYQTPVVCSFLATQPCIEITCSKTKSLESVVFDILQVYEGIPVVVGWQSSSSAAEALQRYVPSIANKRFQVVQMCMWLVDIQNTLPDPFCRAVCLCWRY